MIRGQRVGGGGGPFALGIAVDERAEAALALLDLAGLIVAVAEIPPGHLGVRVIGEGAEVFGKKLGRALIVGRAVGEVGGALGGVVEVFAAQEEIVGRIRCECGIDRFGARHLCGRGAGEEQGDGERAVQSEGKSVGGVTRRASGAGWRRRCSRCRLSGRCR